MANLTKRFPYHYWVVGVAVVWAIVLLVASQKLSTHKFHDVLIFFAGFWIGVLGASIARKVYK